MIIEFYESIRTGKAITHFVHECVSEEELEDSLKCLSYVQGDAFQVLSKVKSDLCDSGYGYIVYDEVNEESFIVDSNFIEITE